MFRCIPNRTVMKLHRPNHIVISRCQFGTGVTTIMKRIVPQGQFSDCSLCKVVVYRISLSKSSFSFLGPKSSFLGLHLNVLDISYHTCLYVSIKGPNLRVYNMLLLQILLNIVQSLLNISLVQTFFCTSSKLESQRFAIMA